MKTGTGTPTRHPTRVQVSCSSCSGHSFCSVGPWAGGPDLGGVPRGSRSHSPWACRVSASMQGLLSKCNCICGCCYKDYRKMEGLRTRQRVENLVAASPELGSTSSQHRPLATGPAGRAGGRPRVCGGGPRRLHLQRSAVPLGGTTPISKTEQKNKRNNKYRYQNC